MPREWRVYEADCRSLLWNAIQCLLVIPSYPEEDARSLSIFIEQRTSVSDPCVKYINSSGSFQSVVARQDPSVIGGASLDTPLVPFRIAIWCHPAHHPTLYLPSDNTSHTSLVRSHSTAAYSRYHRDRVAVVFNASSATRHS
nr:hypothetical protein CFP56_23878 [Quercus suber]